MSAFSDSYPTNDTLCRISSVTSILKPPMDPDVYLNAKADGKALNLCDRVDTCGRQLWKFQPVASNQSYFYVMPAAGTGKNCFLSASADSNHVDLFDTDDESGRQHWQVIPHPTAGPHSYYIRIRSDAAAPGCHFLSARMKDGNDIKLFSNDYGSGRQIWIIKPRDEFFANDGDHPRPNIFYTVQVLSGRTLEIPERLYLSSNTAGDNLDMFYADDGSGRQRWRLSRIGNRIYNILLYGETTKRDSFLSTSKDNRVVDLYSKDDKSGRQQWKLEHYVPPIGSIDAMKPDVQNIYRISINPIGVNDTRRIYLASSSDGNHIGLVPYSDTDRRQLWRIESMEDRRWSIERVNCWQREYGYRAGMNFLPSTASNQLEMFQPETYDALTIQRELGYAEAIGFNCLRVFLHDLLWSQEGFLDRLDDFLSIAHEKNMVVMFVFLDCCWYEHPQRGAQPEPIPGMHNSRWVQSPGSTIMYNWERFLTLQAYIQGVVRHFQHDKRILAWDVWNEPSREEYPDALLLPRLMKVFDWIREINPCQPLTTAITQPLCGIRLGKALGEITSRERQRNRHLDSFQRIQCHLSDVISFHLYKPDAELKEHIEVLRNLCNRRSMICSEYLARPKYENSQFNGNLRVLKENNVYAMHWGLVAGRSNAIYSRPYRNSHFDWMEDQPVPEEIFKEEWFHDMLHADGTPYSPQEVEYIKRILRS